MDIKETNLFLSSNTQDFIEVWTSRYLTRAEGNIPEL